MEALPHVYNSNYKWLTYTGRSVKQSFMFVFWDWYPLTYLKTCKQIIICKQSRLDSFKFTSYESKNQQALFCAKQTISPLGAMHRALWCYVISQMLVGYVLCDRPNQTKYPSSVNGFKPNLFIFELFPHFRIYLCFAFLLMIDHFSLTCQKIAIKKDY